MVFALIKKKKEMQQKTEKNCVNHRIWELLKHAVRDKESQKMKLGTNQDPSQKTTSVVIGETGWAEATENHGVLTQRMIWSGLCLGE